MTRSFGSEIGQVGGVTLFGPFGTSFGSRESVFDCLLYLIAMYQITANFTASNKILLLFHSFAGQKSRQLGCVLCSGSHKAHVQLMATRGLIWRLGKSAFISITPLRLSNREKDYLQMMGMISTLSAVFFTVALILTTDIILLPFFSA